MATNPTNNRLSTTLTPAKLAKINQLLTELTQELDFTVGLTTAERQALPKMNDGSQPFVNDALVGAQQNPDLFPGYVKLEELEKDTTLYFQLGPLVARLAQLGERLLDTQILAGSEAYVTALMIYRLAEAASKAGLPGADTLYQTLRQRFVNQGTITVTVPPVTNA
ncbi:hypothetical protein [Hymenobacter terrenus]|uniref:hypothetical protein n=1 Tax=Hymenobacter terrenus TaxID=1629124 RepID=UPI00061929C1|nr:hypothetical protein [Hymenobacter terrenus]